jgi:Spy/CpxP family protein refolding chaperone
MKPLLVVSVVGLWLGCSAACVQEADAAPTHDPIVEQILPPELILQHEKTIGLSESQISAVVGEAKRTQSQLVDAQWELQREVGRLEALLSRDKLDEQQVLAQLDKLLAVERAIKRAHLALAVRLKNILTPEQQRALRGLRANEPAARR